MIWNLNLYDDIKFLFCANNKIILKTSAVPFYNFHSHGMVITVMAYGEGRNEEMFYLTTHSTHFIYGYMASDHSVREETRCRHMGYSFRLTVVEHWLEREIAQSSMGPPHEGSIRRPIAPWANALTTDSLAYGEVYLEPYQLSWYMPLGVL